VTLSDAGAAELRQMPNVRGVYPVTRHHALLDRAVKVHRIADAVQTFANGAADAGKGIKIGILDTGIDATHPVFKVSRRPFPTGIRKSPVLRKRRIPITRSSWRGVI
jgi:subtilisin family serine protease